MTTVVRKVHRDGLARLEQGLTAKMVASLLPRVQPLQRMRVVIADKRRAQDTARPAPAVVARPTRVGFLLIPEFALMSYASAVEPLRAANRLSGRTLYVWKHISPDGQPVRASNGVMILPDHGTSEPVLLDLLLVCAGGNPATFDHAPTFAWLRSLARNATRIGGTSGGPYVLARAGLLAGYRCTVHWEHAPALAEELPDLEVTNTLFEIDRDRLTCAGGTAALDMMAALIEADHGHELAAAVSDWLVHKQIRDGHDPQRMALRERLGVANSKVLETVARMEANIEEPVSLASLAAEAGVSLRQLERLLRTHLGRTLSEQYLEVRLGRAQSLLRQTVLPILEVAMACGFVSASHFSRTYKARFDHSPKEERRRRR